MLPKAMGVLSWSTSLSNAPWLNSDGEVHYHPGSILRPHYLFVAFQRGVCGNIGRLNAKMVHIKCAHVRDQEATGCPWRRRRGSPGKHERARGAGVHHRKAVENCVGRKQSSIDERNSSFRFKPRGGHAIPDNRLRQ